MWFVLRRGYQETAHFPPQMLSRFPPTPAISDFRHGNRGQELYGLAAGSAFDVTARSESILSGRPSGVYGVSASQVVEAVPPVLDRVRARAPDATTTELVVEYEVRGTSGRLHYALAEEGVATKAGKV